MSKKPYNLSWFFFISIVSILIISFIVLGTFILVDEYLRFTSQAEEQKKEEIVDIKNGLKTEVVRIADYIHIQKVESERNSYEDLKTKVIEASDLAGHLYETYKGIMPLKSIQNLFLEVLRNIHFFGNKGYYFVINYSGLPELFPDQSELEGTYLANQIDGPGKTLVSAILKLSKDEGEGFYEYTWSKPGSTTNNHKKISYVKAVPELEWVIGNSVYLEDVGLEIKSKMVAELSRIENHDFGFLFGATYDGVSILGPAVGQDMIDVEDENGIKVVQTLIATAKSGGGFVEYTMPAIEGYATKPKISYVSGIPEWDFYIGYGIYLDQIDKQISDSKKYMMTRLFLRAMGIILVGIAVLATAVLISRKLAWRFRRENGVFLAAFETALNGNTGIEKGNLRIQEYVIISELINRVLEKKRASDEDLKRAVEERSILLKEIHHRVKNNFQAMASLFSLQAAGVEDPQIRQYLEDAKNRVYSMASVHELFYQSTNFSRIALREYLEGIANNVFDSHNINNNRIDLKATIGDIFFTIEEAVPLGLILNELLTNSCKYAFPDMRTGWISVVVLEDNGIITMDYSDNGVGIKQDNDPQARKGFGFELIDILSIQLQAKKEIDNTAGFHLRLIFAQRSVDNIKK